MAVTLFFVVSGFLMSLILTEKYASRGRFYLNRLLRIFPPFWCAGDFHYHNWGDHPFGLLQGGRQQHLGLLRKREFVGDSLCGHGQHFVVRLSHWPPARFTGLCRCHLFCCREARALFQSNAVRPAGLDASRRARVLSFGTLCTAL